MDECATPQGRWLLLTTVALFSVTIAAQPARSRGLQAFFPSSSSSSSSSSYSSSSFFFYMAFFFCLLFNFIGFFFLVILGKTAAERAHYREAPVKWIGRFPALQGTRATFACRPSVSARPVDFRWRRVFLFTTTTTAPPPPFCSSVLHFVSLSARGNGLFAGLLAGRNRRHSRRNDFDGDRVHSLMAHEKRSCRR